MRKRLLGLGLVLVPLVAHAQLTVNVLGRVVQVRGPAGSCTAFSIELDTKQYLVTARHCVKGASDAKQIAVRQGDGWAPLDGKIIFPSNQEVDIAAIPLATPRTVVFEFQATSDRIQISQPVYFLGFPSSLSTNWNSADRNQLSELAFIKAGILSAVDSRNPDAVVLYVDGQNNPGFSGGPIVFRPGPTEPFRVAGVVSGYKGEPFPVVTKKDLANPEAAAFKDLYVRANAGIVLGYDIDHIVKAINATNHPPLNGRGDR